MKLFTKLGIYALAFTSCFSLQAKEDTLLETQKQHAETIIQEIKDIKAGHSNLIQTGREYTHLLWEAQANYDKLSPESKAYLAKMDNEVADYTDYYTTPDGYFRIWYKQDGVDAVPLVDENENGVPDMAETYGRYMTHAKEKYVAFGLNMPYSNISDKSKYDIYIGSSLCSDNVYGFTRPLSYYSFNCPSYIVLRSDYSAFGAYDKPAGFTDSIAAQITGAHEFQHSCQMIYANPNMSMFLKEGCAVWSEQFVYPEEKDPFGYVSNFLIQSNLGLNYDANHEYPFDQSGNYYLYPYGSWIYFQYLTDMYGDPIIKELYEALVKKTETPAFDEVLKSHGSSFSESAKDFFNMVLLFPNDSNKKPVYFSRGGEVNEMSSIPTVLWTYNYTLKSDSTFSFDPKSLSTSKQMLNRLSCHNYRFFTDRGGSITVKPENANDSLVVSIIQVDRTGNYNDFKISSVKAFGQSATINYTYDPTRPNVYMQVFNYATKYTVSTTGFNLPVNTAYYTFDYKTATAGVDDGQFISDFSLQNIVPMPATDNSIMNINVGVPTMLKYNIYDMSGKILKSDSFSSNAGSIQYNLDLNGFTTGVYFIELTNGIKTEKTNFIVK